MSYDEEFVIDADTDVELDEQEDDAGSIDIDVTEKVTSKQHRVTTRRRVEDILAEKRFKEMYGDIFDEF